MRRIIGLILLILLATIRVNADEQIQVDNQHFQEYKGRVGLWMFIDTAANLNYHTSRFHITIKDVQSINGAIKYGSHMFLPYSERYITELESKGIQRETLATRKSDFIWPISQVNNISSTFGHRYGRFHTGTDMPATKGTPIVAVMDGRILSTRYEGGFGKTICMEHRDHFFTRYAHCDIILVKDGDFIRKGQIIGVVGSTGTSTGNHLHFEIRYNDIPLNPLDFLPYKEHLLQVHTFRNWK